MGDGIPLGYLREGEGRQGFVLSDGIALGILGYLGYMREGDGYLGLLPGVPGVPEGEQVPVAIQLGWSQSIVIPVLVYNFRVKM